MTATPDASTRDDSQPDEHDAASEAAVDQKEAEASSPDHAAGSAEDESHGAPVAKEALTEADKDLPEDQAALQTDSS